MNPVMRNPFQIRFEILGTRSMVQGQVTVGRIPGVLHFERTFVGAGWLKWDYIWRAGFLVG
jgi:hypothetical protein